MANFFDIGSIDVSQWKLFFQSNNDWENKYNFERAKTHTGAHNHTFVIPVQWARTNLNDYPCIPAPKTDYWGKYYNIKFFEELLTKINQAYTSDGYYIRILFAMLKANSKITVHRDHGSSLVENHRIHIPIVTNDDVIFGVGGEKRNLKEGEIVEIDNSTDHWVVNKSSEERIHLIVDWHKKD